MARLRPTSPPFVQLTRGRDSLMAVSLAPDGSRLFAWVRTPKTYVIRVHSRPSLDLLGEAAHEGLEPGCVSPDGRLLGFPCGKNEAEQRWRGERTGIADAFSGALRVATALPGHAPTGQAFSPDGRWLAVGTFEGFRIYDTADGTEVRAVPAHDRVVQGLAWSPDGRWLATRSYGDTAIFDTASWECLARLPTGPDDACSIDFLADGSLVAPFEAKVLGVWAPGAWGAPAHTAAIAHPVEHIAVARAADLVVTAGRNHGVRVFTSRLAPVAELEKYGGEKSSLAVTADGSYVVVVSDGRALVWTDGTTVAPPVDPLTPPEVIGLIASPRKFPLRSVADLDAFVARTRWFANGGQPLEGKVARLASLADWKGAEQPRLEGIFTLPGARLEEAELIARTLRPAALEHARALSSRVFHAAAADLGTDADGDVTQDPATAAVYGARITVEAAAAWLGLGWPLPPDLQTLLAWYGDGRWPCGFASAPREGRKTPILVW